jgi:hypothetical protein
MTLYDGMVYYNPDSNIAAPMLPPVCPKCGSHRTVIVGTLDRGTVTIRCNTCGEISNVTIEPTEAARPTDAVAEEPAAMQTLDRAKTRLAALDLHRA